jgi:hypothetical protein
MKLAYIRFLAATVFAVIVAPHSANGTTVPTIGTYSVSSYVVSATATNGGMCGAAEGSYLASFFYYPGPARAGALERHSINGSQGNFVQELEFPTTPELKVRKWSGSYTGVRFPGGTPQSGEFATTFTFVDADSFVGSTTYTYSVAADSTCTTVFQNTYIRTGR